MSGGTHGDSSAISAQVRIDLTKLIELRDELRARRAEKKNCIILYIRDTRAQNDTPAFHAHVTDSSGGKIAPTYDVHMDVN